MFNPSSAPASRRTRGRRWMLSRGVRHASISVAVVFSAVVALFALGQVSPVPRETTLGRVLTLADQHKVTSATIQGNSVTVSTVGGTSYSAAQKDTRQLTRELLDHG